MNLTSLFPGWNCTRIRSCKVSITAICEGIGVLRTGMYCNYLLLALQSFDVV